MVTARSVALDALCSFEAREFWSSRRFDAQIDAARLDRRDAAFCTYLANGVLQNLYLLDYHLSRLSKISPKKMERRVLCALRLGLYQLHFAGSVPSSAAVNETVKLITDRRSRGFVNAVLRAAMRIDVNKIDIDEPVARASIRYSVPEATIRELTQRVGDKAECELELLNCPPPTTIRVNTRRFTDEEVADMLMTDGVAVESGPLPHSFNITETGNIARLRAFSVGAFWVQDAAAMCAVEALKIADGDRVLDLCSAPGGKSFYTANFAQNVEMLACDVSERKVGGVKADALRLGINITTETNDARVDRPEWHNYFDKIIADLPCSGLGTIRKKPDIRYKSMTSFAPLQEIQLHILHNAARYLKCKGKLLYSTCTWRRQENEDVVDCFLKTHPDFALVPFDLPYCSIGKTEGMTQLWTHKNGTDGFFICVLEKKDVL